MYWRILPHATCCFASERLFLLDLRQDRYFAVPAALVPAMLDWLNRGFSCDPPDAMAALLTKSRILLAGDQAPTNALRELLVIPSAIEEPVRAGPPLSRSRQAAAISATWMRLRLQPLHKILAAREYRARPPAQGPAEAVSGLAARYEQGRSYTPIARNCLLDSLTLDRLLARRGLKATLVFGVCPTPFSAHCWLQTPERILNDSFDHVSRFEPIYAA